MAAYGMRTLDSGLEANAARMASVTTPGDEDILLVVDVQNDFCPGGALAVPDGDAVVTVINGVAPAFEHMAATQDWHPPGHLSFASSHSGRQPFETVRLDYGEQVLWPDHCVQGTDGAAIHPELDLTRAEFLIRKGFRRRIDSYSAFFENDRRTPTGLSGYLRERGFRRLFVCGLALDYCVQYTVLDARREGFDAIVIEDACRGIDLEGSLAAARDAIAAAGATVVTASAIGRG